MISGAQELTGLARELGLAAPSELGRRGLGEVVKDCRSSWVRRCRAESGEYFVKTYDYPRWRDRVRGAWRNTGPGRPSRARREAAALTWLRAHGFEAPAPVGVIEERRFGFVRRAVLVTRAWPGRPLDLLLPDLPPAGRTVLAAHLGRLVRALHDQGFRCRNLDLRNVLAAARADGTFALALLDSPRWHLVRPGRADDASARADWDRLLPQLATWDLGPIAQRAATATPTAAPVGSG